MLTRAEVEKNNILVSLPGSSCHHSWCLYDCCMNLIHRAESKFAGMMKQQVEQGYVPKPGDGSGSKMCHLNSERMCPSGV